MAKFNEEGTMALQAGGNDRAREIYFKEWDPKRNNYLDSSNLYRLREFVEHVYVDRKHTGRNSPYRLSVIMSDSRSNSLGSPSFDRRSNGGRCDTSFDKSSPAKKFNERDLKDMFEERSPRVSQENVKSGSNRGRPACFEIVDDRFRDDGIVKHYSRNINKEARDGNRSPAHVRTRATCLPAVRPIKDLIGDQIPALRISGPPKANDVKDGEGSARSQQAADATNPGPLVRNSNNLLQRVDTGEGTAPNSWKELPQDLFASHYASFAPPAAGWRMHLPYGTGYGMQLHPHAMSVAAYQSRPRARNPFDVGDDGPQAQPAMFPSMSSHGALPNMPASRAQPSPYAAALSSHMLPFGMNMALVPGAHMGQVPTNVALPRRQGTANINKPPEDAFASLNPIRRVSGADSLPDATNSSAFRGANPFG